MKREENDKSEDKKVIVYHHITYGSHYREETEAVRKIIKRGVNPLAPFEEVVVRTYSRPNYTASLLMRNNTAPKVEHDAETNVVYHFVCPDDACRHRNVGYVGLTTQTLRSRMYQHQYKGAIHDHYTKAHGNRPNVETLLNNTTIINKAPSRKILPIAEAVAIEICKPSLNVQKDFDYILPSNRKASTTSQSTRSTQATIPSAATTIPPTITINETSNTSTGTIDSTGKSTGTSYEQNNISSQTSE